MAHMKKLKVLVFEYITGGGLNKSDLSESLATEGLLMLQSLVDNLAEIDAVEPIIMLDHRILGKASFNAVDLSSAKPSPTGEGWMRGNKNKEKDHVKSPHPSPLLQGEGGHILNSAALGLPPNPQNIHIITPEQECCQEFTRLMPLCDAVWPVAPESDAILQTLCEEVEHSGKLLLTSSASTVAIAGNKWLTYGHLQRHNIAAVPTKKLTDFCFSSGEWIIKTVDGVGCADSYVIADQQDFDTLTAALDKAKYIVQPHLQGEKTSLSCLFKNGRGWLVCANRQHFDLIDKQYHLIGITVNFTSNTARYLDLVNAVAKAMPGLWGYAGIDLIETVGQLLILEINPRVTTSYAGIYAALGINCARAVVELLTDDPVLKPIRNQRVNIKIDGKENHAS